MTQAIDRVQVLSRRKEEARNVIGYVNGEQGAERPSWASLDIGRIRSEVTTALSFCRIELGDDFERITGEVKGRLPRVLVEDFDFERSEPKKGYSVGELYELEVQSSAGVVTVPAICAGYYEVGVEKMTEAELEDGPGSLETYPYFHINPADLGLGHLVIGEVNEDVVSGVITNSDNGRTVVEDIVLKRELMGFSAIGKPVYRSLPNERRHRIEPRGKRYFPGREALARLLRNFWPRS